MTLLSSVELIIAELYTLIDLNWFNTKLSWAE